MTQLYEYSTLASLMAGNFDGTITIKDLLKHGSYGLGTFSGLDGEVVILNNEVYQAVSSGKVNHITDLNAKLPFASVHFPENMKAITFSDVDFDKVNQEFVNQNKLNNVFAFLKLDGNFSYLKTRIAPKQNKPYPSLLEVAKKQPEFEYHDIKGTLLGYYAPAIFGRVTASGWHLHFISADRKVAGHMLDFKADNLTGNYEIFDDLIQHFPVENPNFRNSNVNLESLEADISASEGKN